MSASASLAVTQLVPLAKEVDDNKVTPGVLGFIVFAVLALAVWGLMKSMNRHMAKVDFKVPEEDTDRGTAADASGDGADSGATTGGKGDGGRPTA